MTPFWIGTGIVLAGAVLGWVGHAFANTASDEAATAFETYDRSLRGNLNLCDSGQGVGNCK